MSFPDHTSLHSATGVQAIRGAGVVMLVAAWALSLHAPVRISWENGLLENAQVAVLIAAAFLSALLYRRDDAGVRRLWIAAGVLWIILVARELSWGAVFLDPVCMTHHGPSFSSSLLWYRPAVTPIVALALIVAVIAFATSDPIAAFKRAWRHGSLPLFDFFAFAAAMLISTASEGHMGLDLGAWPGDHQILEEAVELAAYIFLLSGQLKLAGGVPDRK